MLREFEYNSKSFNPNLTTEENYQKFKEVYADRISQIKENLIKQELYDYNSTLQRLGNYQGIIYYANNAEKEFTNSSNKAKDYFKSYPSYIIFEGSKQEVFPPEIQENTHYYWITSSANQIEQRDVMYIAFTEEYLNSRIAEWKENKIFTTNSLYQIAGFN